MLALVASFTLALGLFGSPTLAQDDGDDPDVPIEAAEEEVEEEPEPPEPPECATCPPRFVFSPLERACLAGDDLACAILAGGGGPSTPTSSQHLGQYLAALGITPSGTPSMCDDCCILCVCWKEDPIFGFTICVQSERPSKPGSLFDPEDCEETNTPDPLNCSCPGAVSCAVAKLPCFDNDGDGECDYTEDDDGDGETDINDTIEWICGTATTEQCNALRAALKDNDNDGIPNFLDAFPEYRYLRDDNGNVLLDPWGNPVKNPSFGFNPTGLVPDDPYIFALWFEGETGLSFLNGPAGVSQLFGGPIGDYNGDGDVNGIDYINAAMDVINGLLSQIDAGLDVSMDLATLNSLRNMFGELYNGINFLSTIGSLMYSNPEDPNDPRQSLGNFINSIESTVTDLVADFNAEVDRFNNWQALLSGLAGYSVSLFNSIFVNPGESGLTPWQEISQIFAQFVDALSSWASNSTVGGSTGTEPVDPTTGGNSNGNSHTGDPVDTRTGGFYYEHVDAILPGYPGTGGDFALRRFYNSRTIRRGAFGRNWSMAGVDEKLVIPTRYVHHLVQRYTASGLIQGYLRIQNPNHPTDITWRGVDGTFSSIRKVDPAADCTLPPGGYVLREPNGLQYVYCPEAAYSDSPRWLVCWLSAIITPHGERIRFQRNALGQVTKIIDALGRETLLEYHPRREVVTKITLPDGTAIDYDYGFDSDAEQDIAQVYPSVPAPTAVGLPFPPVAVPVQPPVGTTLLGVEYAETRFLDDTDAVVVDRPHLVYFYDDVPTTGIGGNYAQTLVARRLTAIQTSNPDAAVVVSYYEGTRDYQNGRVHKHTVGGLTTTFTYEERSTALPPDAYGQVATHVTHETTPDGIVRSFFHGEDGQLLRKEITEPASIDPTGRTYVTLYEYNSDYLLTVKTETTATGYPQGRTRRTEWVYDSSNGSRFRQSDVLQVKFYGDFPTNPPAPLTRSYQYEPIFGQVMSVTDEANNSAYNLFNYQEEPATEIESWFGVKGWNIDLSSMPLDLPDLNGDGKNGKGGTVAGLQVGRYGAIISTSPSCTVEDPSGPGNPQASAPTTIIRYNEKSQVLRAEGPNNSVTTVTYQGFLPVQRVSDPGGINATSSFTIDSNYRLKAHTDTAGFTTEFTYDARGQMIEARRISNSDDTDDIIAHYFYDAEGRPVGEAGPFQGNAPVYVDGYKPELQHRRRYDGAGQLESVKRNIYENGSLVDSGVWQYVYDGLGNPSRVTNPKGAVYETVWNHRGQVVSREIEDANNNSMGAIHFEHNQYGDVIAVREAEDSDGDGAVDYVQYLPDGFGRPWITYWEDGRYEILTTDNLGRVTDLTLYTSTGQIASYSNYQYDPYGRVLQVIDANIELLPGGATAPMNPLLTATRYGYGPRRELLWSLKDSGGANLLTKFEYDALGRIVAREHGPNGELREEIDLLPDGRATEGRVRHDLAGHTGPIDPSTTVTKFFYEPAFGNLSQITAPDLGEVHFAFTARDELKRVTDPLGTVTEFDYDSAGRLITATETGWDGKARETKRQYSILDDLIWFQDGEGRQTWLEYDEISQLRFKTYADGSGLEHRYDSKGRLTETWVLNDPTGRNTQYDYDAVNRITAVSSYGADADVFQAFEYSALGHVVRSTETVGARPTVQINRRFGSRGQLLWESQTIGTEAPQALSASFDGLARTATLTYPSGLGIAVDYDGLDRVDRVRRTDVALNLFDVTSQYGRYGYRAADLLGAESLSLERDASGRVKRLELLDGTSVIEGGTYDYDLAGNLQSRTRLANGRVDSFDYDGFHRLTDAAFPVGVRTLAWDYDRADNFTLIADSGQSIVPGVNLLNQFTSFGSGNSIQYNENGEEQSRQVGGTVESKSWDALGRLIEVTENGQVTEYLTDATGRVIRSTEFDGRTVTYRRYGGVVYARETEDVTTEYVNLPQGAWLHRSDGNHAYTVRDPFGNVLAEHAAGVVSHRVEYDPFGRVRDLSSGTPLDHLAMEDRPGFVNRFLSPNGTVLTDHRHFDPEFGRFVNRDPLGEESNLNLYAYAGCNPYRWSDPTGLSGQQNQGPKPGPGGGLLSLPWKEFVTRVQKHQEPGETPEETARRVRALLEEARYRGAPRMSEVNRQVALSHRTGRASAATYAELPRSEKLTWLAQQHGNNLAWNLYLGLLWHSAIAEEIIESVGEALSDPEVLAEIGREVLSAATMVPGPVGAIANAVEVGIALAEGDFAGALLAALPGPNAGGRVRNAVRHVDDVPRSRTSSFSSRSGGSGGGGGGGGAGGGGGGGGPRPYEVDTYDNLRAGDQVGDGLQNHHVPQKAVARDKVDGYPQDKMAGDAPAIRLPDAEHTAVNRAQRGRDTTELSDRDLLADDIRQLRQNTNAPNSSLKELIELNKEKYGLEKQ